MILAAALATCSVVGCKDVPAETTAARGVTTDDRSVAMDAAMAHLDAGRTVEALAITSRLVAQDPHSADAHETHALVLLAEASRMDKLGDAAGAAGGWLKAYGAYDRACELRPDAGLLHLSAGQVAQAMGMSEEARRHYTAADELVPDDPRASFFLGQMALMEKDWESARRWLERNIAIAPGEPYAMASMAIVEVETGEPARAIRIAGQACRISPADPMLRVLQARVHRIAAEATRGIEILTALSADQQATPAAAEELAACWDDLGYPEEAANALATCWLADRSQWKAALGAARILMAAGRQNDAVIWLERARQQVGDAAVEAAMEGDT